MEQIQRVNRVFLITVAAAVAASFFIGSIPAVQENQLLGLLISQLVYAVPILVYLLGNSENPFEAIRLHRLRPASILLLAAFTYFIMPLLNLLDAVSRLFSTNVISGSIVGIITEYPLWVGITVIGLVPAILEESVYRGVFFNEYRKQNPRLGIFVSGLLFGLMHMNFNQFVYAFVMGVIFALLVEATDSLLASMVVHFTINSTSVVAAWVTKGTDITYGQEELLYNIRFLIVPAAVMTAGAFGLLYLIAGLEGRRGVVFGLLSQENKKRGTVITLPLLFGIGICFAIMIYIEVINRLIL